MQRGLHNKAWNVFFFEKRFLPDFHWVHVVLLDDTFKLETKLEKSNLEKNVLSEKYNERRCPAVRSQTAVYPAAQSVEL